MSFVKVTLSAQALKYNKTRKEASENEQYYLISSHVVLHAASWQQINHGEQR
jgi:hypothetical protein